MARIQLGDTVKDSITGFEGVAIARTEWLYGCVRLTVQPRELHDGRPIAAETFDEPQLVAVEVAATEHEPATTGGPRPEPQTHGGPA